MQEPLDATKYSYAVSVFIDRRLTVADPTPNPNNSSKINLDMEGAQTFNIFIFNPLHVPPGFPMDDTVSTFVFSKPLPPKLLQVIDDEVTYPC